MKEPRKSKAKMAADSPGKRSKPIHIPMSFDAAVDALSNVSPKKTANPENLPQPKKHR